MSQAKCWLVSGLLALVPLGGCGAVGGLVSAAGAIIKQDQDGEHAEVFTRPLEEVQPAVLTALERIGIDGVRTEITREGAKIVGKTRERDVQVLLKPITAEATRMTVSVGGFFNPGGAVADEVIQQTRLALAGA